MITFKQYITEARAAPLYHATRLHAFVNEIMPNGFGPYTPQWSHALLRTPIKRFSTPFAHGGYMTVANKSVKDSYRVRGISTTRSFTFAKQWIPRMFEGDIGIVVEFDQQKLAQKYKIVPFNFFGDSSPTRWHVGPQKDGNEYEEFIIFDKKLPVSYINKIYVHSGLIQDNRFKPYIDLIRERFGASNIITYR